mmetsp:Transcript_29188/g.75138  ORF Transcript_29188/g.75138 Transcript_29188/m.75138 type:complete len:257 (+) Transcript_29188:51-821(+)
MSTWMTTSLSRLAVAEGVAASCEEVDIDEVLLRPTPLTPLTPLADGTVVLALAVLELELMARHPPNPSRPPRLPIWEASPGPAEGPTVGAPRSSHPAEAEAEAEAETEAVGPETEAETAGPETEAEGAQAKAPQQRPPTPECAADRGAVPSPSLPDLVARREELFVGKWRSLFRRTLSWRGPLDTAPRASRRRAVESRRWTAPSQKVSAIGLYSPAVMRSRGVTTKNLSNGHGRRSARSSCTMIMETPAAIAARSS